jgi:hypothetical protein
MSLVLKNGIVVGSANISCLIGGVIVTGIKSIDFSHSQKKENIQGFQKEPIGRGRGLNEYPEGSMDILLEEYKGLVSAAPNRDIKQIGMFSIPIVYDNNILPAETLSNAEFTSVKHSYKSGDTAEWISIGFIYAGISS